MSARALFPLVALGCGELAGGDYIGEPLYTLTGNVLDDGSAAELDADNLRIALFWANDGAPSDEQDVVVKTRFPAEYTLQLYAYPPEEARFAAPWDPGHRYAIGTPLVYADLNGDERWNTGDEPVLGGAYTEVVLFAESSSRVVEPNGQVVSVTEGFSRVLTDEVGQTCSSDVSPVLAAPKVTTPTDLEIGAQFGTRYDWNCDGTRDEYEMACGDFEDIVAWCLGGNVLGGTCEEYCYESGLVDRPSTNPDGTTGGTTEQTQTDPTGNTSTYP